MTIDISGMSRCLVALNKEDRSALKYKQFVGERWEGRGTVRFGDYWCQNET